MKIPNDTKRLFSVIVRLLWGGPNPAFDKDDLRVFRTLLENLLTMQFTLFLQSYDKRKIIRLIKQQRVLSPEAKMIYFQIIKDYRLPN